MVVRLRLFRLLLRKYYFGWCYHSGEGVVWTAVGGFYYRWLQGWIFQTFLGDQWSWRNVSFARISIVSPLFIVSTLYPDHGEVFIREFVAAKTKQLLKLNLPRLFAKTFPDKLRLRSLLVSKPTIPIVVVHTR